jgi:hypothetical protein
VEITEITGTHRNRILDPWNIAVNGTTSELTTKIPFKGVDVTIREQHQRKVRCSPQLHARFRERCCQ